MSSRIVISNIYLKQEEIMMDINYDVRTVRTFLVKWVILILIYRCIGHPSWVQSSVSYFFRFFFADAAREFNTFFAALITDARWAKRSLHPMLGLVYSMTYSGMTRYMLYTTNSFWPVRLPCKSREKRMNNDYELDYSYTLWNHENRGKGETIAPYSGKIWQFGEYRQIYVLRHKSASEHKNARFKFRQYQNAAIHHIWCPEPE